MKPELKGVTDEQLLLELIQRHRLRKAASSTQRSEGHYTVVIGIGVDDTAGITLHGSALQELNEIVRSQTCGS